ncbi:MAG: hypothetical protein GC162_16940 [Planctomycetes bacterium]|nr:hypothetical protein [Planctomycetota bacterium]
MNGRVLILSDTHLGRPEAAARSAQALRPLWQRVDHLVLNGDVAEVHHPVHRGAAARQVVALQEMCEEDGVAVTMLSGNHDPYLSDRRHLHLCQGRVFVTHGDVMHPSIAPWSPSAEKIRTVYELAMAKIRPELRGDLEQRLAAAQHAAHAEWAYLEKAPPKSTALEVLKRPWIIPMVLAYWRRIPHLAVEFAAQMVPEARFIILGHTHRHGIWKIADRVVINTGSYGFPGKPRAVLIDGGEMTVWPIVFDGQTYHTAANPLARFDVTRGSAERLPQGHPVVA